MVSASAPSAVSRVEAPLPGAELDADVHEQQRRTRDDRAMSACVDDRRVVALGRGHEIGAREVRRHGEGDERERRDPVADPPRAGRDEHSADEHRPERRAEGPRRVQRAHEPDATLQRGLHVHRGVEEPETRAEDRGGGDHGGPRLRDREQREPARREKRRHEQERERAEPLAHDARQTTGAELRHRHRRKQYPEAGQRRIEGRSHGWPSDAEHAGR
jgi:hypothetical protein